MGRVLIETDDVRRLADTNARISQDVSASASRMASTVAGIPVRALAGYGVHLGGFELDADRLVGRARRAADGLAEQRASAMQTYLRFMDVGNAELFGLDALLLGPAAATRPGSWPTNARGSLKVLLDRLLETVQHPGSRSYKRTVDQLLTRWERDWDDTEDERTEVLQAFFSDPAYAAEVARSEPGNVRRWLRDPAEIVELNIAHGNAAGALAAMFTLGSAVGALRPARPAAPRPAPRSQRPTPPQTPAARLLPPLRQEYVDRVTAIGGRVARWRASGLDPETTARRASAERRAIGAEIKARTPPELREEIYARNLEKYGDPLGPTIEWYVRRGDTWEEIADSASRPGGRDLGF